MSIQIKTSITFVIAASGTETGNTFLKKYCEDNTRALYMDLPSLELKSPNPY
ncbi:hypothetical protein HMPREF9412_5113 [Paenibacillus sp. HGF5]|nr:hypothetical protein HMPREF9412_5113 [Paenibacillus sp. HGF5]